MIADFIRIARTRSSQLLGRPNLLGLSEARWRAVGDCPKPMFGKKRIPAARTMNRDTDVVASLTGQHQISATRMLDLFHLKSS